MSQNSDIVLALLLEANTGLSTRQLSKIAKIRHSAVVRALASLRRYDLARPTGEKDVFGGYVWEAQ